MGKKDEIIAELNKLRQAGGKRDWIRNECLANSDAYAKTDHAKEYVLYEAEDDKIQIAMLDTLSTEHEALYRVFIREPGTKKVRFPFNTGDSIMRKSIDRTDLNISLSPDSYADFKCTQIISGTKEKLDEAKTRYPYNYQSLIRWSTASRSSIVAIPVAGGLPSVTVSLAEGLTKAFASLVQTREADGDFYVPLNELAVAKGTKGQRFCEQVTFTGRNEITFNGIKYKLYSLKTGVCYIGNKGQMDKNLLEANSAFAMSRSQAIARVQKNPEARDSSWVIQKELLTITSLFGLTGALRDGFQVRDLSDFDFLTEDYLPGQAIPHSGTAFSTATNDPDSDLAFWKRNFAYPLGRAKARLFLEYGLMQTSVNAQNFVIAFGKPNQSGGGTQIRRLILRDIGDSFWHNTYVESILGEESGCSSLFKAERDTPLLAHTLTASSSTAFPAPLMLRFGPGIVINGHGFGVNLKGLRSWSNRHLLQLGQEITDGFLSYVREVGLLDQELVKVNGVLVPKTLDKQIKLADILNFGQLYQYSGGGIRYTEADIARDRANGNWASLEAFQAVRKVLNPNTVTLTSDNDILWAHTAEEICLCLALENSICNSTAKQQTLKRLLQKQNRLPDVVNYPRQ